MTLPIKMIKYCFPVFLLLLVNCSVMDYKPVTKEAMAQSGLRYDGVYICYQRKPEPDSGNISRRHIPELDPAHLSIYMFSREGRAVYRGIRAEMWQIPITDPDNRFIFDVLFHRLSWAKSDLLEEYKKADSYSLTGKNFVLTSYNRRKIYRYTRECKILDDSKIVIDQDTFKFKKYYANYNVILAH